MQNVYILIASFAIACAIYFLYFRKRNNNSRLSDAQNPYFGFRQQAFSITPDQLQLQLPENEEVAYGAFVDLGMSSGSVTTVCFSTGDASLYNSHGGGIIGGGVSNKSVIAAAINFVSIAQKYFPQMTKTDNLNVPIDGYVKFYVLTNRSTYSIEETESSIVDPNSKWAEMFIAANELILQLRVGSNTI